MKHKDEPATSETLRLIEERAATLGAAAHPAGVGVDVVVAEGRHPRQTAVVRRGVERLVADGAA